MIRKLLAAVAVLAALTSTAHADATPPAAEKSAAGASAGSNSQSEGFRVRRPAPAPTAIRVSLPATAEVTPDRFRATVMFDATGGSSKELAARADAALAKVHKAASRVPGIAVKQGMRMQRTDPDMRCAASGACSAAGATPRIHAELELETGDQQALEKALEAIRKAAASEPALHATGINVEYSEDALQKALRAAMRKGRLAAEAAAADLAKDGERWHIAEIRFDQPCTAGPVVLPQVPVEPPPLPIERMCNTSPEVELRTMATILIFPAPKP